MSFTVTNQRAYKEMMALARDAQQWALVVAAWSLRNEWKGSVTPPTAKCSSNHQCAASCRRSRSSGQWEESSQVTPHCRGTEAGPGSSQVTSCCGGTEDINWYEYQKASWVTSHQRGAAQEQTWSPTSTRQKHQITFAEGWRLVPEMLGESPRHGVREHQCNAKTQVGYQLLPPSWQEGQ